MKNFLGSDKIGADFCCPICHKNFFVPKPSFPNFYAYQMKGKWYCSYGCFREAEQATKQKQKSVCPACGKTFVLTRPNKKFCSNACQIKFNQNKKSVRRNRHANNTR